MTRKAKAARPASDAKSRTKVGPKAAKTAPKMTAPSKPAKSRPRKIAVVQAPTSTPPSKEQIDIRAYEIWLRKGRPLGQDTQNWFEAEAELKASL